MLWLRQSSTPPVACAMLVLLVCSSRCVPFFCRQAQMPGIMAGTDQRDSFALIDSGSGM